MKLGQMTNLNVIFHVVVSVYRLVTISNSPQFPVEFRNGLFESNLTNVRSKNLKANLPTSACSLFSDKARCFSQSECALYGTFIIMYSVRGSKASDNLCALLESFTYTMEPKACSLSAMISYSIKMLKLGSFVLSSLKFVCIIAYSFPGLCFNFLIVLN